MNEKRLRLLEIAGFKQEVEQWHEPLSGGALSSKQVWVHEATAYRTEVAPDLYNSLDAQDRYLLPMVRKYYWITLWDVGPMNGNLWACTLDGPTDEEDVDASGNTWAHAFAEAVLKAYKEVPR